MLSSNKSGTCIYGWQVTLGVLMSNCPSKASYIFSHIQSSYVTKLCHLTKLYFFPLGKTRGRQVNPIQFILLKRGLLLVVALHLIQGACIAMPPLSTAFQAISRSAECEACAIHLHLGISDPSGSTLWFDQILEHIYGNSVFSQRQLWL